MNRSLQRLLWGGLIVGGISVLLYLAMGHSLVNYSSAVPWGLWVAVYIWLIGISAGVFFLVMLGNALNNPWLKKITGPGLILALVTLPCGLLSIQLDLGHIERFYKIIFEPSLSSILARMTYLYGVYFLLLLITAALFFFKKLPAIFSGLMAVFSLIVIIGESLFFASPPGKHWHSFIFPLHFLVTSLLAGSSFLTFLSGILGTKNKELIGYLAKITYRLLIVTLIVEIADSILGDGIGGLKVFYLLAGIILPIYLLRKEGESAKVFAALLAGVGVLAAKYHTLIWAQLQEPLKGFAQAFTEPGVIFQYRPSLNEWLVVLFIGCLAIFGFSILYKLLPRTKED